jgi:hypothetical protein
MQLTLRGIDVELETRIRQLARREGISLNRAVLRLLAGRMAEGRSEEERVGEALDRFIGSWSDEDTAEFLEVLSELRAVDEEMWR